MLFQRQPRDGDPSKAQLTVENKGLDNTDPAKAKWNAAENMVNVVQYTLSTPKPGDWADQDWREEETRGFERSHTDCDVEAGDLLPTTQSTPDVNQMLY